MSKTYAMSVNKNEIRAEKEVGKSAQASNVAVKKNYEIEKNMLSSQKKTIKESVSKVSSYADIVLGNKKSNKVVAVTKKKVVEEKVKKTKPAETKTTVKVKKLPKEKVVEKEKTVAKTLTMPEVEKVDRNSNVVAEVSERISFESQYDSDAQRVINIARMGSLFDYLN